MKDIEGLVIGAIVMLALSTAGITMISMVNDYNPTLLENSSREFNATANTFKAVSTGVNNTAEQVQDTLDVSQDEGKFGFLDTFLKAVTTSAQTIGKTMTFFTNFFLRLDTILPIPGWVGALMSTAIILIIGFAIWKLVFAVT